MTGSNVTLFDDAPFIESMLSWITIELLIVLQGHDTLEESKEYSVFSFSSGVSYA